MKHDPVYTTVYCMYRYSARLQCFKCPEKSRNINDKIVLMNVCSCLRDISFASRSQHYCCFILKPVLREFQFLNHKAIFFSSTPNIDVYTSDCFSMPHYTVSELFSGRALMGYLIFSWIKLISLLEMSWCTLLSYQMKSRLLYCINLKINNLFLCFRLK